MDSVESCLKIGLLRMVRGESFICSFDEEPVMAIQRSRPFHETIVEAILECSRDPLCGQLRVILKLIKKTAIPKNHDRIIEAIGEYFNYFGPEVRLRWQTQIEEVTNHLLEEKQHALVMSELKADSAFGDASQIDSDGELPPVPDPDSIFRKRLETGDQPPLLKPFVLEPSGSIAIGGSDDFGDAEQSRAAYPPLEFTQFRGMKD